MMANGKRWRMKRRVPWRYFGQRCGARTTLRIAADAVVRKSTEAITLRARYQRIASRNSSFASGWNRNGLLSIRELFGELSEHLFAGDRFYTAGADVVDAAFDLVVPGCFDAFFRGLFV